MRSSSRKWISRALLLVACGLAAVLLVPALLGFDRYVITGDSMAGTYGTGTLLYEREVPVAELRVGDVITYDPPAHARVEGLVTHRIVSIERGRSNPLLRTRGDANAAPDPWRFRLTEPTQPRVAFAVPYLGHAFSALDVSAVRALVIAIPALLIAIAAIARLVGDGHARQGAEVRDA